MSKARLLGVFSSIVFFLIINTVPASADPMWFVDTRAWRDRFDVSQCQNKFEQIAIYIRQQMNAPEATISSRLRSVWLGNVNGVDVDFYCSTSRRLYVIIGHGDSGDQETVGEIETKVLTKFDELFGQIEAGE
jgi:hypothetical protein